jgi:hypothetical protein
LWPFAALTGKVGDDCEKEMCEERADVGGEAWCRDWGGEVAVCTEREVVGAAVDDAIDTTERRDDPE